MTAQTKKRCNEQARLTQRNNMIEKTGNTIAERLENVFAVGSFEIDIFHKNLGDDTNAQTMAMLMPDGEIKYKIVFDRDYLLYAKPARVKITLAHELAHCYTQVIHSNTYFDEYDQAADKNLFTHDERWDAVFRETGYYVIYDCKSGGIAHVNC